MFSAHAITETNPNRQKEKSKTSQFHAASLNEIRQLRNHDPVNEIKDRSNKPIR
jgi:hypothetical protein